MQTTMAAFCTHMCGSQFCNMCMMDEDMLHHPRDAMLWHLWSYQPSFQLVQLKKLCIAGKRYLCDHVAW
jgi:hypothetical protein